MARANVHWRHIANDTPGLLIVTGPEARKRISDRDAKLAALSMAASFGGGDLAGGIISGLDQLATHAGRG